VKTIIWWVIGIPIAIIALIAASIQGRLELREREARIEMYENMNGLFKRR